MGYDHRFNGKNQTAVGSGCGMATMTREDLVRLVEKIRRESGCIVDLDALISRFEANVRDPASSAFIFESPTGRLLSATEVVERAMKSTS
ncbi:MAG: hypothetical protein MK106_09645 [Mariniblastus sp.]|nr:hypothetical protein [Mariniblastus sp.]